MHQNRVATTKERDFLFPLKNTVILSTPFCRGLALQVQCRMSMVNSASREVKAVGKERSVSRPLLCI